MKSVLWHIIIHRLGLTRRGVVGISLDGRQVRLNGPQTRFRRISPRVEVGFIPGEPLTRHSCEAPAYTVGIVQPGEGGASHVPMTSPFSGWKRDGNIGI